MKLFQWALFAACLGSMACGAQASPALVAQATTAPVTVPSVRSSYPPTVAPVPSLSPVVAPGGLPGNPLPTFFPQTSPLPMPTPPIIGSPVPTPLAIP